MRDVDGERKTECWKEIETNVVHVFFFIFGMDRKSKTDTTTIIIQNTIRKYDDDLKGREPGALRFNMYVGSTN